MHAEGKYRRDVALWTCLKTSLPDVCPNYLLQLRDTEIMRDSRHERRAGGGGPST